MCKEWTGFAYFQCHVILCDFYFRTIYVTDKSIRTLTNIELFIKILIYICLQEDVYQNNWRDLEKSRGTLKQYKIENNEQQN